MTTSLKATTSRKKAAPIKVAVVGLGWVGLEIVQAVLEDTRFKLVGVADTAPNKAGQSLQKLLHEHGSKISSTPRINAATDVSKLLKIKKADVAILTTTSSVEQLMPTLFETLDADCHVVTTCENLAYPALAAKFAKSIDTHARKRKRAVLATGVNPGFAMDRLPVMLSQASRKIERVRVRRTLDAGTRRPQLQSKIGIGKTVAEFRKLQRTGDMGHAGLLASLHLLAQGLGFKIDRATESLDPIIASKNLHSPALGKINKGLVAGIEQTARAYQNKQEVITLELIMQLGAPKSFDTVDLYGTPNLHSSSTFPGDACTVATVISALPLMSALQPGLRTVLDLPLQA